MLENIDTYKNEIVLGPIFQSTYREIQGNGRTEERPRYLKELIEEHLRWKLKFSERELEKLEIMSIKPLPGT